MRRGDAPGRAACRGPSASQAIPQARSNGIAIDLGQPLEIGRTELLFGSVVSVCEDDKGDFYVLDQREQKVLQFSPDGRRLGAFGRKGQGPGDFQSPGRIAFTPAGELAVFEDIALVSFHRTDGAFIRRLDLNGRLGLGFIGPDRFYGWEWEPETQRQVLVDAKNAVVGTFHSIPRERFSAVLPDETGRMVMFNYSHEAYVPRFLYAYGDGLSAVGISDRYEIALLDRTGHAVSDPAAGSRAAEDQRSGKELPRTRARGFRQVQELAGPGGPGAREEDPRDEGRRPRGLRFADPGLRPPLSPDITIEPARWPVDVFTRAGAYLGAAELPEIPLFISSNIMYFAREDAEGNVYLVRRGYSPAALSRTAFPFDLYPSIW
ncbi:MAG: hypothetical protein M0C28_48100 [Candidatus Moduliflexus flocculans]|nr:hypothetical protein [Candidatus Moduliflexus flocculans]